MSFDVFLSHNSQDRPAVQSLGEALKKRGLTVWLDEWELRPGLPWQDALEAIIRDCKSAVVCFGGSGIGPWEEPEMQVLLRRFINEKKTGRLVPIIPVLLPGAPENVKLPLFLEAFTWVDLRSGLTPDGLERLRWGITGEKPRENAPTVCLAKVTPDLRTTRHTVAACLTSAGLNVLPAKPYPADPAILLAALEADLDQADVFVQILGATYADRTDELPEGDELGQFIRAQQRGKKILQWRDKSVAVDQIEDNSHRELVGGANVVCSDLTDFVKRVIDTAHRIHNAPDTRAARTASIAHQVFISYSREDRDHAKRIARILEDQGWTVWWDVNNLFAGEDFHDAIEDALDSADCIVVVWSKVSGKSRWVKGEAEAGLEMEKLVPVKIDDCKPPINFRSLHTRDLSPSFPDLDAETERFIQDVTRHIEGAPSTKRENRMSH